MAWRLDQVTCVLESHRAATVVYWPVFTQEVNLWAWGTNSTGWFPVLSEELRNRVLTVTCYPPSMHTWGGYLWGQRRERIHLFFSYPSMTRCCG